MVNYIFFIVIIVYTNVTTQKFGIIDMTDWFDMYVCMYTCMHVFCFINALIVQGCIKLIIKLWQRQL